ncbi:MAG: hypothetical protein P8Z35_18085 [Ignavibacteriaceae bacterium]
MGAYQNFSDSTEIEKLLKRDKQLSAKTKPTKYLIISSLPLYRLINQTKIPCRKASFRDLLIIELELESQEECAEELQKDDQRSEISVQKSEDEMKDETEPP